MSDDLRHICLISGKDSLATTIVQMERSPDLPYEFLFNPTGLELPEVFDWLDAVEKALGIEIIQVWVDLEELIKKNNYFLPSQRARYCTRQCKIEPMEEYVGEDEAFVYYGIRADENRTGHVPKHDNLTPKYPLIEEGIDLNGVYRIINDKGLKPPTFFCVMTYELVKTKL